ncbi:MAG TPA: 1-acyl-sn-glycerol-3-phosphate acyltransferase [Polyangiaceae bacterium]|nr:1-acyl-sn-glycerol-3-phosphate acyltransferase [Polyangiaceae bacterium]
MPPSDRPLTRTYEPNPLLEALYRRFFHNIQVDESWVSAVRSVAGRGHVVYILPNLNFIDFFALDHLTKRYDLPRIRFANDLGLWILAPMGKGWLNAIRPPADVTPAKELRDALKRGGSAALFLKRPPSVLDVGAGVSGERGLREGEALVRVLLDMQRESDTPILLVPQLFVWTRAAATRGTSVFDFLIGPREWPSPLRTVGQFLYNYKNVALRAGEPLNLKEYLANAGPVADDVHVRRLTYAMLRRLQRERRSITGPAAKPPDRVRHEIVRSPKFRAELARLVKGKPFDNQAVEQALKMLRQMQATPDGRTIGALGVVLSKLFNRIYAGVDVDQEGLERVRKATKEGRLVLLPSHKSHIDYLVVSYVFNQHNLQLPMIAAGDNLAFFPVGPIFRRAGAFFIRRSFRGDALYPAVVDAYIRRLLRDGFPIELFLEGSRSRSGKLLEPKFGLLSMVVNAALSVPGQRTFFVPISIGYERIVETSAYQHEMSGGEKPKEDAAGLLGATGVLRYRYGRMNLQVGQILDLETIQRELGFDGARELSPAKRRAAVTRLGNRVMDEINRVSAVTPGALAAIALLSHHQRGVPHEKLIRRCDRLLKTLQTMSARTSPGLVTSSGALRPESIREAAQMFIDGELIQVHGAGEVTSGILPGRKSSAGKGKVYTIPVQKRGELDISKNIIVHFFVERGLVASVMVASPGFRLSKSELRDRTMELSRLFKHEFRFRADASFDQIFEQTLEAMQLGGEVLCQQDAGEVRVTAGDGRDGWTGQQWLLTYASFLRNFLEGYRIAARALVALIDSPASEKDLIKHALVTGHRMYDAGEIERREAISKLLISNAFSSFFDLGYVAKPTGKLQLAPPHDELTAVRSIENSLSHYLDRTGDA